MARNHALSGVLIGCGIAAVASAAPWPVRALVVATAGGAALLPDLDTPRSTAARSLGAVTRILARGVAAASLAVYHATRGEADPPGRRDGHRAATHTVPASLTAGAAAGVASLAHPAGAVVVASLLAGLLGLGVRVCGASLAAAGAMLGGWAATQHPGWWWLTGVAVAAGCLAHLAGDAVTPAGVPVCWPVSRGGRRWASVASPVTIPAGGAEEAAVVTPLLTVAVAVAAVGVAGWWAPMWDAVAAAAGGGGGG